jgi:hypothetical protein
LTLLDRQYQQENKAADISTLQAKIAKDRALAVDAYSSQGQAAAARLVDEEARLAQLQREQGHDAAKNAIEDRIKSIDREKQATDEAAAARTRALQEQMDALRANTAAAVQLSNAIAPPRTGAPAAPGLHDSRPPASATPTPPLLDRIFGTPQQQLEAVNKFWANLGTGLEHALQGDSPTLQAGVDAWLKKIWEGGIASFARTGQEDPNMNVTNWLLDALGLPRDQKDQQPGPRARTGLGPADSIPSQPPPGHSEPGHWINVGGSWLWRADDPTAPRTTTPPVPDSRPPGVTTTPDRSRDAAVARMHVTMDFNDQGFRGFIDQSTGRALENAVRP